MLTGQVGTTGVRFNGMSIGRTQNANMVSSSKVIEVVDVTDESVVANVSYRLEQDGVPKTQARPRLGRGGFYNPNSKDMSAFRARIKGGIPHPPIFGVNQPVAVNIKFFMRRPNTHFKCNDRLKPLKTGLPVTHITSPDIENNLTKFVLDGMNKLVYEDDKQAVKLTALKLYDSEGGCDGRTVIAVTKFDGTL